MNSNDLSQLSLKELKRYIQAYCLPSKTAIEKEDLVRIIFNTRPLSNENELHYRSLQQTTSPLTDTGSSNPFSFTNIVQDIFTSTSPPRSRHSPDSTPQPQTRNSTRQRPQSSTRQQSAPSSPRHSPLRHPSERHPSERPSSARQSTRQSTRQPSSPLARQSPITQTRNPSPPVTQSPKPENTGPSLQDIIQSHTDISSLSVKTLKSILKANFVEQSHVIEKSELVKLVQRLAEQQQIKHELRDDILCRICLDAEQNCVFLNCGHMAACMDCAKTAID
ncbi:hypothetical protein G6F56_008570 [Rhizopus delemar]|nr:hypothetical protein G6F56_008570 [Rhizopus delemar]